MAPDARDEALTALLGQRGSYDSGVRGYRGVAVAVAADIAAGACTAEQGRADFNLVAAGTADVTGHDGVVGCDVTLVFDDGQRLAVTTPTTSPPGTPDTATLGRALARIDPALRGLARRLVINPVENPHDVVVRQTPGFSPTHRSAATALAGADVIHLYPGAVDAALDAATDGAAETWLVALLTHELAHLLQARVERAPDLAAQWRQAVRDDVVRASAYAFSTDGEDFAEAVALHLTSRGTPTHDALRGLMPGRFAAIDAILQALPSLSAPSSSSSTSSSSSSSGPNS